MADTPYYYVKQSDVETYLNTTLTVNGQALFTLLQEPMQALVDQYLNRTYRATNPVSEDFDALTIAGKLTLANYEFFPQHRISQTPANVLYPLAKGIISVTIGAGALDLNYVVSYDTYVKFSASFPSVILANPLGFKMVHLIYNSDEADACPGPVKIALIQWMARVIQESPDAGKETTRVAAGTVNAGYVADKISGIPNFVRMVLDLYRVIPMDHM